MSDKLICHRCGNDHYKKLDYWCDTSELEIKHHNLQQELTQRDKEIEQLRTKIEQERSHIRTCHIAMEGHHKEIEQLKTEVEILKSKIEELEWCQQAFYEATKKVGW